jgi:hypothetical protein
VTLAEMKDPFVVGLSKQGALAEWTEGGFSQRSVPEEHSN